MLSHPNEDTKEKRKAEYHLLLSKKYRKKRKKANRLKAIEERSKTERDNLKETQKITRETPL